MDDLSGQFGVRDESSSHHPLVTIGVELPQLTPRPNADEEFPSVDRRGPHFREKLETWGGAGGQPQRSRKRSPLRLNNRLVGYCPISSSS